MSGKGTSVLDQPGSYDEDTSNYYSGSFGGVCVGRKGKDAARQLRPAGIASAKAAGIFDEPEVRVPTPEHVRPFRKSAMTTVGRTIHHYGTRNNEPIDPNTRFGKPGTYDFTAEDCLRPKVLDKMGALAAEHAEKRYLSAKEPLGKVPPPSIPIPEHMARRGFGLQTRSSESAKHVIYSCGDREAPELHPAGAQRDRKYDWASAGIDPTRQRFGATSVKSAETTKDLINPTLPVTTMLPKIVRDQQTLSQPQLGKPKCLGLGHQTAGSPEHPNAIKIAEAKAKNMVDVKQLISGHGCLDDEAYEKTLGKSYTKSHTLRKLRDEDKQRMFNGSAVSETAGPNDRAFGVPTVRNDLPKPLFRKVTSSNNYGDDVGAQALLFPNRYVAKGIDEYYFTEPKDLAGIKDAVIKCNFGLTDKQIEDVFNSRSENGLMSVEMFKDACYDMNV